VILADEFRDGNVPAGSGNRREVEKALAALPEDHWKPDQHETDAIREWAEVNYLPSDGIWRKDAVSPRRYLASFYR